MYSFIIWQIETWTQKNKNWRGCSWSMSNSLDLTSCGYIEIVIRPFNKQMAHMRDPSYTHKVPLWSLYGVFHHLNSHVPSHHISPVPGPGHEDVCQEAKGRIWLWSKKWRTNPSSPSLAPAGGSPHLSSGLFGIGSKCLPVPRQTDGPHKASQCTWKKKQLRPPISFFYCGGG